MHLRKQQPCRRMVRCQRWVTLLGRRRLVCLGLQPPCPRTSLAFVALLPRRRQRQRRRGRQRPQESVWAELRRRRVSGDARLVLRGCTQVAQRNAAVSGRARLWLRPCFCVCQGSTSSMLQQYRPPAPVCPLAAVLPVPHRAAVPSSSSGTRACIPPTSTSCGALLRVCAQRGMAAGRCCWGSRPCL